MENKNLKYRKTKIVMGVLTVFSFIMTVVLFFVFSTFKDSQKEETYYSLTALGTLLFSLLFLVFMVLFIIFSALNYVQNKKISKLNENKNEQIESTKEVKAVKDENVLYQYSDTKVTPLSAYLKGIFYNAPLVFFTFLILFILSFFLLLLPLKTSLNDIVIWIAVISIITIFGIGWFFIFLINPLIIFLNNKKNLKNTIVYIYDDKIRFINEIDQNNTCVTIDSSIYYSKMIKAKKDKVCYYFIYTNEKNQKACLMLTYKDINNIPVTFLDDKIQEINKRK